MTLTIALIVNGALVACLFVALYLVMRIPFRMDADARPRILRTQRSDRRELSRAA